MVLLIKIGLFAFFFGLIGFVIFLHLEDRLPKLIDSKAALKIFGGLIVLTMAYLFFLSVLARI